MKFVVEYTTHVTKHMRRAMKAYYGRTGLATNSEVLNWYRDFGNSMNDTLNSMCPKCGREMTIFYSKSGSKTSCPDCEA